MYVPDTLLFRTVFSFVLQRREKGKMRVHKLQNIQNVLDYLTTKKKVMEETVL